VHVNLKFLNHFALTITANQ